MIDEVSKSSKEKLLVVLDLVAPAGTDF